MTRRMRVALAVVTGAIVLFVGAGLVVPGSAISETSSPRPVVAPAGGASTAEVTDATAALEARLDRLPGDWQGWSTLGSLRLQRAATTADPGFYASAEAAFERSLQERPAGNDPALVGRAALAASRHDFDTARSLAKQAITINPYSAPAHGVLTDALVELGDYEAASVALQQMLDLRPGVASYARASYLFELRGDVTAARQALEQARRVATEPGDIGFVHRYLGELAFGQGDLEEADRQFSAGLVGAPSYTPLLAGRARVAAARGDVDAALDQWGTVVERLPEPGYLAELGDLYASLGRHEEARAQYEVIDVIAQLFVAAGADLDLEQSIYLADHGEEGEALRAAERVWRQRQSVHAADAYAWALHVNGRSPEALDVAEQAQRLGTRIASFDYHRGMIQLAVGDEDAARASLTTALDLNPHFSVLHAPRARAALERLG